MKKKKTIYKARYVVEIETYSLNDVEQLPIDDLSKFVNVEISLESSERTFAGGEERVGALTQHFDYIEEHFPSALADTWGYMWRLEATPARVSNQSEMYSALREVTIKEMLRVFESKIRKRMRVRRGPKPKTTPSEAERIMFLYACAHGLANLKAMGRRLNKNELARYLYPKSQNWASASFSKKLREHQVSPDQWESLVAMSDVLRTFKARPDEHEIRKFA